MATEQVGVQFYYRCCYNKFRHKNHEKCSADITQKINVCSAQNSSFEFWGTQRRERAAAATTVNRRAAAVLLLLRYSPVSLLRVPRADSPWSWELCIRACTLPAAHFYWKIKIYISAVTTMLKKNETPTSSWNFEVCSQTRMNGRAALEIWSL